ncbi:hypothetical protein O3M35_009310 [Rhynocoris fuscipes]|uniref:Protein sleepless n=1 Tax=Rhynocoris fuscipes TaxID=488301 RepID=A0AAW1D2G0_9HEMI
MTGENSNFLSECTPDFVKQATDVLNSGLKKFSEITSSLGFGDNKPSQINTEFICAKVDFTNGNKTWSVRQCTVPAADKTDFCKQLTDAGKDRPNGPKVSFCDTCNSDGCNGSSGVQAALMAVILPSAALILAHLI